MITLLIFIAILGVLLELLSIIGTSYSIATLGFTDILSVKLTLSFLLLAINASAAVTLIAFQKMKNDL